MLLTSIHPDYDPISNKVTVGFDEVAMEQVEREHERGAATPSAMGKTFCRNDIAQLLIGCPSVGDPLEALETLDLIFGKVSVDDFQNPLSRIGLGGHLKTN